MIILISFKINTRIVLHINKINSNKNYLELIKDYRLRC